MSKGDRRTSYRLGDDTRKALEELSQTTGRTKTDIIREAVAMYARAGGPRRIEEIVFATKDGERVENGDEWDLMVGSGGAVAKVTECHDCRSAFYEERPDLAAWIL